VRKVDGLIASPSVTARSYPSAAWAERWQSSWDRLEERYVPDRELRLRALLDITEAVVGMAPTVVDLGCGTGTITRRLLRRFPEAKSIAVDIDPVLLTIASATFRDDTRVRIKAADLRDPDWVAVLGGSRLDAALTATALHWLPEDVVQRLYHDLAGVVRKGGVVAHAELMPLTDLPRLHAAMTEFASGRPNAGDDSGRGAWDSWWTDAAMDPALRDAAIERRTRAAIAAGALAAASIPLWPSPAGASSYDEYKSEKHMIGDCPVTVTSWRSGEHAEATTVLGSGSDLEWLNPRCSWLLHDLPDSWGPPGTFQHTIAVTYIPVRQSDGSQCPYGIGCAVKTASGPMAPSFRVTVDGVRDLAWSHHAVGCWCDEWPYVYTVHPK
jgi:trans-aconitate methyltransferase